MIRSLPEHPNSYSESKRNGILMVAGCGHVVASTVLPSHDEKRAKRHNKLRHFDLGSRKVEVKTKMTRGHDFRLFAFCNTKGRSHDEMRRGYDEMIMTGNYRRVVMPSCHFRLNFYLSTFILLMLAAKS